jgi:hypothetical protein
MPFLQPDNTAILKAWQFYITLSRWIKKDFVASFPLSKN